MSTSSGPQLRVGGTLGITDLYVERLEDSSVYDLLAAGEFCNILTSRQMGKSSLMVRLMTRLARDHQARIASVDMAGDLGTPDDADRWYIGFLDRIALQLGLELDVEQWWYAVARGTANSRLLQFFRKVVDDSDRRPLHVFIDEVDASLKLAYSDDLFTALRTIYNQRATVPEFRRLTFCLIGVASPSELIKERRTTPYNIGRTVELRDFDPQRDDLRPLYTAMSPDETLGRELVTTVLAWTDGHPFLTAALCHHLRERGTRTAAAVSRTMHEAITAGLNREVANHLESIDTFLATRLHDEGKTLRLYRKILQNRRVPDQALATHLELRLSGLVKRNSEDLLVPRNRVYLERFGPRWLARTRPMRSQRRLLRVAMLSGALAAAATSATLYFVRAASSTAAVPEQTILATLAATDADDAADKLDAICSAIRGGALIDAPRLATVHEHVRALWRAVDSADQLEARARRAGDAQNLEEALLYGAKAGARSGHLPAWIHDLARRYRLRSLVTTLRGHHGNVAAVRWLAPGRIISIGSDDSIRLFDVDKGLPIGPTPLTEGLSPAIDTCADGSCILTAVRPAAITLWDRDLRRLATWAVDERSAPVDIWSLSIFPNSSLATNAAMRIATSNDHGEVWVGRMPTLEDRTSARSHFQRDQSFAHISDRTHWPVYAARFSAHGDKLVTAALDGVRIIDVASGAIEPLAIGAVEPHDARLSAPEPSLVAVAARYEAVIYDLVNRRRVRNFQGAKTFQTIAFVPGNKQAVIAATTTDNHGLFLLWRIQDDRTESYETPSLVRDAEVSVDTGGVRVATAHSDGAARVWQVDPEPPDDLAKDPGTVWLSWQHKLGLTVEEHGQVRPLDSAGARRIRGEPAGCEHAVREP